jgi:hypothetical protein
MTKRDRQLAEYRAEAGECRSALVEVLGDLNPDALLADGLDEALVGWTVNSVAPTVAVYDACGCVQTLVRRDGMTADEAEEFLEFNTFGAYVGPNGPIFVRFLPTLGNGTLPPEDA